MSYELELAHQSPRTAANVWIDLVAPAADLARTIAGTDFVPQEMKNKPAAITACILFGAELGLGPMQALAKIDVVKGRPAPRAELARALALAAGHDLWVEETTNTRVKVSGCRKNSEHIQSVTWTLDDVKKAGIANGAYAKYPRQMLLARASAELVRMMCPEVLGGIGMVAEEISDGDTSPIVAAESDTSEPVKATTRRRREPAPVTPVAAAELPELPDDTAGTEQPTGPTDAQMRKLQVSFNDNGFHDRDERLKLTKAVIRRDITTSKELTKTEVSNLIDFLERLNRGDAAVTVDEDGNLSTTDVETTLPLPGEH